jgi:hypothetical protein
LAVAKTQQAAGNEPLAIQPAKIRDYLLSTSHPVGRFKAPFFASLGYTTVSWRRLDEDLRALAVSGDADFGKDSPYGQKYEVRGNLTGPSGRSAGVLTVWIIRHGGTFPQFVTAFPEELT